VTSSSRDIGRNEWRGDGEAFDLAGSKELLRGDAGVYNNVSFSCIDYE